MIRAVQRSIIIHSIKMMACMMRKITANSGAAHLNPRKKVAGMKNVATWSSALLDIEIQF
jgi:hypothetical protein